MRRRLIILCLAVTLSAGPVWAESYELPVELKLPEGAVALELWNAEVKVVLEPVAAAVLRSRRQFWKEGEEGGVLSVASEAGVIAVRRGETGGETAPRILIELTVEPARRLRLSGHDLDVEIAAGTEAEEPEEPEDASGDERGSEPAIELDVGTSNVRLLGVGGASVESVDGYLRIDATRGRLDLALAGGTAEIEGHRGVLSVASRDGELDIGALEGAIESSLTGGSLTVRGGRGRLQARVEGAGVRIDGWLGAKELEGRDASLEVLASRGGLVARGERLEVLLEGTNEPLDVNLLGGRLTGAGLEGGIKLALNDAADAALDELRGSVILSQRGGSARLAGVAGFLRADVQDGTLDVAATEQLELVARRSEIVAREVTRLRKVEVEDSRLDLDLRAIRHNPSLVLRGTSEGRVTLRTPCYFKMAEAQLLTDQVEVTGCILQGAGQRRTRYDRHGLEGNRRVVLTASLGSESSLEVEGTP